MATTAMLRVRKDIHATLHRIAEEEDVSMQDVLVRALEFYRRQRFLEDTNRAFAALRMDPTSWAGIEQERELLDGTLMDGLSQEEEFASWRL